MATVIRVCRKCGAKIFSDAPERLCMGCVLESATLWVYPMCWKVAYARLVPGFIKEHKKVEKLEAALAAVNKRLTEQDTKIERVSATVQLNKPAELIVTNKPQW